MSCPHCVAAGTEVFVGPLIRRELKRYRRKGPTGTTRLLLHGIVERGVEGGTHLDVGGGIGVLQQELLASGVAASVGVDASPGYVEAAREEAARRGTLDRVELLQGDFVDVAPDIPPADIVTLDRVICCYPHVRLLVAASAARTRRLYGLVLPREHVAMRAGMAVINLILRLRRSAFRVYLHSAREVEDQLRNLGFRRTWATRTWLWQVRVYRREASPGSIPPHHSGDSRESAGLDAPAGPPEKEALSWQWRTPQVPTSPDEGPTGG